MSLTPLHALALIGAVGVCALFVGLVVTLMVKSMNRAINRAIARGMKW